MPSGLNQILPRMRVTSDALRISALVAVGVTTGYFWRAAFEVSPSTHPVSAPVNIVEPTPKPPVLSTVKPKPVVPIPHIAPRFAVVISSPSGPLIFQTPSPSVRPASPDKPAPRPPVPTSPPPAPSPQPGTPTPPVTTPTPTTQAPTTPAPTTPASPAKGPVAGGSPPPPVVTQPPAQPPPPTKGDDDGDGDDGHQGKGGNGHDGQNKPGWGHGDENHDHSGPKGHGG
jgi:hypothetical protein